MEESLCLLYVALTRAVYSLHMVIAPSKANEKTVPDTFAGVLRTALAGSDATEAETTLYEHGDPLWFAKIESRAVSAAEVAPTGPLHWPQRPEQPTRGLDHRSPSRLEGGGLVHLASQLRLERGQALDRGTLLHLWFEQIGWLEDGEPDDAALRQIACAKKLEHLDLPELLVRFRTSLRKPAVVAALRKATYQQPADEEGCRVHVSAGIQAPVWELFRERSFAVGDESGILRGAFDRLVVLRDGQQVVAADILDFKTDEVPGDDPRAIDARVEQYRPQLAAYRRAAAAMLAIDPKQVSARLLFVGPGVKRAV